MTDAIPTVIQVWFKKPQQVPAYLNSLDVTIDSVGFKPGSEPGVEVIPKMRHIDVDISGLHDELVARGLTLTHASHIKRKTYVGGKGIEREFDVIRFHYFPSDVARTHDGMDTEKLVNSFREIAAMGFFNLNVHVNPSATGEWMSVNLDGRKQRYIGENLTRPVVTYNRVGGEKVGDPYPIMPTRTLKFQGNLLQLVSS